MSLLAELQRRNVIRMAGLYLVGAWLFESLEDSMDKHVNGSDPVIALRSPELAAYRKHPRYLRLLRKAGFDDAGNIR